LKPRRFTWRQLNGLGIVAQGGQITRLNDHSFIVESAGVKHRVRWKQKWSCDCLEFKERSKACEHVYAVLFLLDLPNVVIANTEGLERTCPRCGSNDVVRHGHRLNKTGSIQMRTCNQCSYTFPESHIRGARNGNSGLALIALDLHYKGVSYADISNHLLQVFGIWKPGPTIFYWVRKFEILVRKAASGITLAVGDKWLADEMVVIVRGKRMFMWDILDFKSRVQIMTMLTDSRDSRTALEFIRKAISRAGKAPKTLMTDGLPSYSVAVKEMPEHDIKHVHKIKITAPKNTNRIERLHSTVRRWERPGRGLKNQNKDAFEGYSNYYNFIRPHGSLKGRSPGAKGSKKGRWLDFLNREHGKDSQHSS